MVASPSSSSVSSLNSLPARLPQLLAQLQGRGASPPAEGADSLALRSRWGTAWGEDGYLRISRQPDDCGIASQPIFVELDPDV